MVKSLLDYYAYTKSYLMLKFKNVVKFHVHIRPIFSCRVTYAADNMQLTGSMNESRKD